MRRLLVRDLAQVLLPGFELLPDAYVLCEGDRIAGVGRMRDLRPLGEIDDVDGTGLIAIPGLID